MRVFKSKIDILEKIPELILIGTLLTLIACLKIWWALIILGAISLVFIWVYASSNYIIKEEELIIKGLFSPQKQTISLNSILKISKLDVLDTYTFYSSFKNSLNKIKITYNRNNKIIITPSNQNEFIRAILEVNKEVKIDRNLNYR